MGLLPGFLSLGFSANRSREDTLKESARLFNNARSSIKIVAGRLDSSFYQDQRTINALNKAVIKGAVIQIACYSPGNHGQFCALLKKNVPNARVSVLKHKPNRHWAIVDGKHVRIEGRHKDDAKNTPAIICRNSSALANVYADEFDSLEMTSAD